MVLKFSPICGDPQTEGSAKQRFLLLGTIVVPAVVHYPTLSNATRFQSRFPSL